MTLIWLGLAVSSLGIVLLVVFGLLLSGDSPLVTWGFWLGLALMTIGLTVNVLLT